MMFRAGGGEGGDDIYIPKEGKGNIGKSAYYLTLVLFLSPQVRKSHLNPSFR